MGEQSEFKPQVLALMLPILPDLSVEVRNDNCVIHACPERERYEHCLRVSGYAFAYFAVVFYAVGSVV
jgi:hypothetical protein